MASATPESSAPPTHESGEYVPTHKKKVIGVKVIGKEYQIHMAVRIIVKNSKDEIIFIFAKTRDYYKLPGGGIDGDEDHQAAVAREAMEETGCTINQDPECIAVVEEYEAAFARLPTATMRNLFQIRASRP